MFLVITEYVHSILRKFTDKCIGKDGTWKDKHIEVISLQIFKVCLHVCSLCYLSWLFYVVNLKHKSFNNKHTMHVSYEVLDVRKGCNTCIIKLRQKI